MVSLTYNPVKYWPVQYQCVDKHGRWVIRTRDNGKVCRVDYLDKKGPEHIPEETEASKRAMEEYKKRTDLEEAQRVEKAGKGADTNAEAGQCEKKLTEGSDIVSSSA